MYDHRVEVMNCVIFKDFWFSVIVNLWMDIVLFYNNKLSGIRMLFYFIQRHKLVCDRAIL